MKKLVEERGRNSTDSDLRGGQPGHKGSHRVLVPREQVHEAIDMFPARSDDCHATLPKTPDPAPTRHQHIELAPMLPHVTEFRRHEVCCPNCGHRTRAHYDDDVMPRYAFGPRVAAVTTLLTGVCH